MPNPELLPPGIRSPLASDRRAALKQIGSLSASQRAELLTLRASEPDAWVRRGMDRSLAMNQPVPLEPTDTASYSLVDPEAAREIREQARVEIAELLVHEIRHAVLDIELAAEAEIDDYRQSETRRRLDRFRGLTAALSQLADSSKGARLVETSLAEVVSEACRGLGETLWPPDLIGPPGIVVMADPGLLSLAVANCVRNALDATLAAAHNADPVIVTWGKTDRDAWVVILDDGVGLAADSETLFQPHHTTKGGSGHAGLGLTIARNSLSAMGGEVFLEPRQPRGASCELRWPRENVR